MNGCIKAIDIDDLDEVVCLHCKYLNYGNGIRPHFKKVISDKDNISLKYIINGEIEGLFISTKGIALSGGHKDICEEIKKITKDCVTYTGDALLIREKERHKGIYQMLIKAMYKELLLKEARYIVTELWRYPDGSVPAHSIVNVFKRSLFLGTYKNFYKDFYKCGWICPVCGENCICSADIYICEI